MKITLRKKDFELTHLQGIEGMHYKHKNKNYYILEGCDELANVYEFYLYEGDFSRQTYLGSCQDTLCLEFSDNEDDLEFEFKSI